MRTEQDSYDTALAMVRIMLQGNDNVTLRDVSETVEMVYKYFGADIKDEKLRLQPFNLEMLKKDLADRFDVES